jgi:hypothetical protein
VALCLKNRRLAETARLCRSAVQKGLPFRKLSKDISKLRLEPSHRLLKILAFLR